MPASEGGISLEVTQFVLFFFLLSSSSTANNYHRFWDSEFTSCNNPQSL